MRAALFALGAVVITAIAIVVSGCKPSPAQLRTAAVVGAYEAALDACIVQAKDYASYASCADEVDRQFQLTHAKTGDQQ